MSDRRMRGGKHHAMERRISVSACWRFAQPMNSRRGVSRSRTSRSTSNVLNWRNSLVIERAPPIAKWDSRPIKRWGGFRLSDR